MKAMQDMQKQIAAQMALSIRSMPAQGIKMFFDQDLDNWKQQAADKGNDDRAKYQKASGPLDADPTARVFEP